MPSAIEPVGTAICTIAVRAAPDSINPTDRFEMPAPK